MVPGAEVALYNGDTVEVGLAGDSITRAIVSGFWTMLTEASVLFPGQFNEARLMARALFERQQDTLQEHLVEAHRNELFLGAGPQSDPVPRHLDTKLTECPACTSHGSRSLRRIPERIAAARDIDGDDTSVWERA
jgi:hypothetical protein